MLNEFNKAIETQLLAYRLLAELGLKNHSYVLVCYSLGMGYQKVREFESSINYINEAI